MADLSTKIELYLGRKIKHNDGMIVQDDSDGNGQYIRRWDGSIEKPKPTNEQLNAFESQANDIDALNEVYANRSREYPSVKELIVALYDSEDKADIDARRLATKQKFPKP